MSGATCPSCGVAVLPGYARCPKCRKPLPRRAQTVMGGTAVDSGSRSSLPVIIGLAVVIVAVIVFFIVRGSSHGSAAPVANPEQPEATPAETVEQTSATPEQPGARATTQNAAPDPGAVADRLERSLKSQRLWSTVSIEGNRVDVRSSSCNDPAMASALAGAAPSFKAAGLTKLRCLEESGQVVSDRDL